MKKIIVLILALLALTAFTACRNERPIPTVSGIEHDGLIYTLSDDGASYTLSSFKELREEYSVPESIDGIPVTKVGYSAFDGNTELTKITLPDTITEFRPYAFNDCTKLSEINFPKNLSIIDIYAFSDCASLKTVKLPEALKTIRRHAFLRCKALDELHINKALETIELDAFKNCGRISSLHLADTASWCGVSIEDHETNPIAISDSIFINGELTDTLIIEGVEVISNFAFYKLSGIKTIIIGEGVTTIGASAFSNCKSVEKIYLSDSVERIETSAFNSCSKLFYLSVGKKANYFAGLAFYGCENLQSVDIQDLAAWCNAFFYTDNSGTANPMRYADKILLNGVDVTDNLVIPEGVKTIKTLSFISFPGKQITLPASLKTVEKTAFYQTNLKTVYYRGNAASWKGISFGDNNFNTDTEYLLG